MKRKAQVPETPLDRQIGESQKELQASAPEIINQYERLIKALPIILESFDIEIKQLCKEVGIARGTFYNRLKNKSFTPEDLRLIFRYIQHNNQNRK